MYYLTCSLTESLRLCHAEHNLKISFSFGTLELPCIILISLYFLNCIILIIMMIFAYFLNIGRTLQPELRGMWSQQCTEIMAQCLYTCNAVKKN